MIKAVARILTTYKTKKQEIYELICKKTVE